MLRLAGRIAAVLALTSAAALAQSTGTISGTVTDAVTMAPLVTGGESGFLVTLADGSGATVSNQPTGTLGQFSFTGLASGTYYVRVTTSGTSYVSELYDDIPCVANDCAASAGTPLTLTVGATVQANFGLSVGGSFSGTVARASDSTPIQGAAVIVYNASTSFIKTVLTDANGAYTVAGLPAGSYFARVGAGSGPLAGLHGQMYLGPACISVPATPDFGCRIASGTPIVVTAGATTAGIDFRLSSNGAIAGRVVQDGSGQPIVNERVELYAGEQRVGFTTTTLDGTYVLVDVPPGFYSVRTATTGNFVDEWFGGPCVGCPGTPSGLTVGGSLFTGVDFSLGPGGQIRVTIDSTPTSQPTLPPIISVYSASGALVRQFDPRLAVGPQPYLISGLATGQYYLVARDPALVPFGIQLSGGILIDQLYPGVACVTVDCDPRRGLPVSVSAGSVTDGIAFHMTEGASSQQLSGSPFPGAPVLRLYDARGVELTNVVRPVTVVGQQVVGLPPGTYYAALGDQLHGVGLCVHCPPTAGKPIVIRPGQLDFTLDFGAANRRTISGTVRNESGGAPLSTIIVELLTDSGTIIGSAVTDVAGRYTVSTGEPGTMYYVRTANDRGFVDEIYPGVPCARCDLRRGTPVVVTANRTGIDFTLAAGGLVSGRVFNTNMNVLPDVPISVMTPAGTLVERTKTFADGRFRVTVPAGTYRARAEATALHGAQVFMEQPCTSVACDVSAGTPIDVTAGGDRTNVAFLLPVCRAMTLTPGLLASAVRDRPYRQAFTVSGGTSPITFDVASGVPPGGLSLTASGVLSGTPTSLGRHAFSVNAIDASGCSTSRAFTIDVHACAATLAPGSATLPSSGGDVAIAIGDSCGVPAVDVSGTFVTVLSRSSTQVVLSVPANVSGSARSATVTIGRRAFVVNQGGLAMQPPFGSLDAPADGAQVDGSVPVGGWALDDLEVRRVRIYRDPVGGEPAAQVFLGDAVFVPGARPDVRAVYPASPNSDRAGWGFLILTNMLPNQGNGVFRIYAYAEDAEGFQTLLGARTIVAVNSTSTLPFGAIDTPAQGATVSGSAYINFGWALTPQPKVIPADGSTIAVYVDGRSIGSPTYNQYRADIATFFPGYANAGGAVGYRAIDTTALEEGLHTIAWVVADNLGAAAGIGSRYFTVTNSADAQAAAAAGAEAGLREESLAGMPATRTATVQPAAARSASAGDGSRQVRLRALGRLELRLEDDRSAMRARGAGAACEATWAGYSVDDGTLAALPVGAAIDPAGIFYWQPGPGFTGAFELLFVRTDCDGRKERMRVRVTIDT